jgi:RNA polymerase sigma factor (sigma-70 family)
LAEPCRRILTAGPRFAIVDGVVSRFSKQLADDHQAPANGLGSRSRPDELAQLVGAAIENDPDAAATLIQHLGGSMLRVVRKVLGRAHPDIDDVTQDAVIAFLGALETFRGECQVVHFAQRIAILTALAARRRMRLRGGQTDFDPDGLAAEPIADENLSPLATIVAGQRRHLVRRLLDELPDVIAESLALHFVLGYTVEEIASTASVPVNTVWSRLRLGKRALRRKLDGDARLAEMLSPESEP